LNPGLSVRSLKGPVPVSAVPPGARLTFDVSLLKIIRPGSELLRQLLIIVAMLLCVLFGLWYTDNLIPGTRR